MRIVSKRPKSIDHEDCVLFQKKRYQDLNIPLKLEGFEYQVEFDPDLRLENMWVSDREIVCFNQMRDEAMAALSRQKYHRNEQLNGIADISKQQKGCFKRTREVHSSFSQDTN